ncbi:hypothetical protein KEJ13_03425 [Candidatus Bathyarchaeota archaeon]|nr:hypothetical protein [Candidatus Bathyarchaeota archaeon]
MIAVLAVKDVSLENAKTTIQLVPVQTQIAIALMMNVSHVLAQLLAVIVRTINVRLAHLETV